MVNIESRTTDGLAIFLVEATFQFLKGPGSRIDQSLTSKAWGETYFLNGIGWFFFNFLVAKRLLHHGDYITGVPKFSH